MCLFTHFAAGALAGGLTGNVFLGAAAGAASHAALDAIPHYDHPDWRLELAGGVLSLVLLLFMPFVTAPAIVGGIFGMVPDLENLFQKLGKMRRDQFVFPSHTGLIPHGRTLGPRSIVWQVGIFVGCFLVLGLLNPAAASAAGSLHASPVLGEPVVRVLSSDSYSTRIEVLNPAEQSPSSWEDVRPEDVRWGRRMTYLELEDGSTQILPPRVHFVLAVPTTAPINARIVELDWWKEPSRGEKALSAVEFGRPGIHRHVPLTGAEVPLGVDDGILRRLVLEIPHPPAGQAARQLQAAPGAADKASEDAIQPPPGVLNPELFQELQAGGLVLMAAEKSANGRGPAGLFGLTENWLRLEIDDTGLFRLTGQELSNMGLALTDVDPAKLRLYRGGSVALDPNPEIGEAAQAEAAGLNEVAIQLIGGQDGEWNLDDEIRFYAFPGDFWLDRVDPLARPLNFYNHPWENHGIYWLTWENVTTPSALPGAPARVSVVDAGANGGQQQGVARLRRHFENQTYEVSGAVADNWLWEDNITTSVTRSFSLQAPLADSTAVIVTEVRGHLPRGHTQNYEFRTEVYANGNSSEAANLAFTGSDQTDSLRVRVVGQSASLMDGTNSLTVRATNPARTNPLMLDSFDVFYWSPLDLGRHAGQLEFTHWRDEVSQEDQAFELKITVPASGSYIVWDVTDPRAARALQPGLASGELTCGVTRSPTGDSHYLVTEAGDLLSVSSGSQPEVVDLRNAPVDAHYITIYHEKFAAAALRLNDFRDTQLPGVSAPVARAVRVDDIYANYSGGQKDAYAIRNYLQHVFEEGGGNLRYVCLVGNTTNDPRNYKGQDPNSALVDLVPSIHKSFFPDLNPYWSYSNYPFGTDDPLVSFDAPEYVLSMDVPEVAMGRLPAVTVSEAEGLVDRMIAYASDTEAGLWRNRFIFVADDGIVPRYGQDPVQSEERHIEQAEELAVNYVPASIDMEKIFGHTFDLPSGSLVKPEMRADINSALSDGASMWYYVGHGAENNLADEQIFQSEDISSLTNGHQRFVFVAFSCDVGVYNSTSRRSMAELFITAENGGAIGSICASQVSFINSNNTLSDAFFSAMFPGQSVPASKSLGQILLESKVAMTNSTTRRNSQRFNLLCDPATFLPYARDDLQFAADNVDTLRSGARQVVTLDEGRNVLLGNGDTYFLRVEESGFDHGYIYAYRDSISETTGDTIQVPMWHTFEASGSAVFDGSGTMEGSQLAVPFKVPAQLRYGDRARVRLLVHDGQVYHAANAEIPAVREALSGGDDVVGPQIQLAFEDNRYRVKAGTELRATLSDTSSIAILSTTPGNSILLEFDGTGFMTNVTRSFSFDANSYQAGSLSFPLPGDLPMGAHKAALFASDALGNVGNDTISFVIVPESVVGVEDVTLFPNPTPGPCRLLMELSDPMLMKWDIFTTAGRRIKTVEENLGAGPQILNWDGRDDQGDEIANGTYIYVLRGQVAGGGERDITKTGKLVIMR